MNNIFETYYQNLTKLFTKHIPPYSGYIDCGCDFCKLFHQVREIHVAIEKIDIQHYWPRTWNAEWAEDKLPFYNTLATDFMSIHPIISLSNQ